MLEALFKISCFFHSWFSWVQSVPPWGTRSVSEVPGDAYCVISAAWEKTQLRQKLCQHFSTSALTTDLAKNKLIFNKTQLGFLVCQCQQNALCPLLEVLKPWEQKCFRNLLSAHLGLRGSSWEDAACCGCWCCNSFGECREQCDCRLGFGIGRCETHDWIQQIYTKIYA